MPMKEITVYDLAKELDLNASTVSRALKNNPVINEATRRRVNEYAREVGYRSNSFASNLRTRKTNTIGVIVPRLDSSFMSACMAGMEEVASEQGYNLLITQSHESKVKEEENSNVLYNKRVDGMIVSLSREGGDLKYLKRFKEKNVPIVFFDRVPDHTSCSCFVIDNSKMAYEVSKHMLDQGCRKLVHLTIESELNVYRDRTMGFFAAVEECRDSRGEVIYLPNMRLEDGKAVTEKLIESGIDGVFASNDLVAAGCLCELQARGIRIPEDIAIAGFNNDNIASIVSPGLTTVDYPGREAGRQAMRELLGIVTDRKQKNIKAKLRPELLIRESSLRKGKSS